MIERLRWAPTVLTVTGLAVHAELALVRLLCAMAFNTSACSFSELLAGHMASVAPHGSMSARKFYD
jgi:hypothetical protein